MGRLPLYQQIAEQLRHAIELGHVAPGAKLPSIRQLAAEYKTSALTVMNALRRLEDQLLVTAKPRSGYYVRRIDNECPLQPMIHQPLNHNKQYHLQQLRLHERSGLTLSNGHIDLYPVKRLSQIMRQQIYRHPELLGGYVSGQGYSPLIEQIQRRALAYGCSFERTEILITHGGLESLSLALRAITQPGDNILVQTPTYFFMLELARELGLNCIEIQSVEQLDQQCITHHPTALVYTANFNNPDGALLTDSDKQALVTIAERHHVAVIEDDVYGDVHFGRSRPRPLRAFSPHVILCSSFTKTLAPGIRIGWIAASGWQAQIAALKHSMTKTTAIYPQAAIAEFLSNGGYDAHLRRLTSKLREYRDKMRHTILEHFPIGTQVSMPEGGYVLWVSLPNTAGSTRALFELATSQSISFVPGYLFSTDSRFDHCLRVNFGYGLTPQIEQQIQALATVIHSQLDVN